MSKEQNPFIAKFNTELTPANEKRFAAWVQQESKRRGRDLNEDLNDYDLKGYWINGGFKDTSGQGHMPDTYKKPNHPTFSTESMYHNPADGFVGGTWSDKGDFFTPGKTNLVMHGAPKLQEYFKTREPNVTLKLPNINY